MGPMLDDEGKPPEEDAFDFDMELFDMNSRIEKKKLLKKSISDAEDSRVAMIVINSFMIPIGIGSALIGMWAAFTVCMSISGAIIYVMHVPKYFIREKSAELLVLNLEEVKDS
ncbi:MAG: hypothetical protein KAS32_06715 [Candidatus Peribacteraceae bacterium]|nr:hypothetical protein [Candidatus Peribacteraceae bacterium]